MIFIAGLILGTIIGIAIMCLLQVCKEGEDKQC